MKWPKLPKFRLPNWIYNLRLPKFFRRKEARLSFYTVWKKFIRQVPAESRPTIKAYQHFIVLGNPASGKSELIQGLTEQSQDLYPFDTSFTAVPDLQFYLGPTQIIQEVSFSTLEDKTIQIRKEIIRLWKKLYAHRQPIVLVVYNCFSNEHHNLRDLNRLAQLIAGKISLLSEITKKPCKIRIALTHLDKVPGYLEFARFLKQQNLDFDINLSSHFDSNALESALKKFFEEHLNLMLTTNSSGDFAKILHFAKEMPALFPNIEEFLRALVSRVSFSGSADLDLLTFNSNQRTSTAAAPFQWKRQPTMELFFRYPQLKHQIAAAAIFLFASSFFLYSYFSENNEMKWAQRGIEQLDLLQFDQFQKEVLPKYVSYVDTRPNSFTHALKPNFLGDKLVNTKNDLAKRLRKHFIEREVRKATLEHNGELRCLYFIGLMHAYRDNNLGKYIIKNSNQMAKNLNINEDLLIAYVSSCGEPLVDRLAVPLSNTNPFLPLTSMNPWITYLENTQAVLNHPILIDQHFEEVVKQTDKLLLAIHRLKSDPITFAIATLLEEELGVENSPEDVQLIRWIGIHVDTLEPFLAFIKQTSTLPVDIEGMNVAQFFTKMKEFSAMREKENLTYNFTLDGRLFTFQTSPWVDLVTAHNVERGIQKYITSNNNTAGDIFFRNTPEIPEPTTTLLISSSPIFKTSVSIPGHYSRVEYEKKVKSVAEKLVHLIDSLEINPEEKKRFQTFLAREVISYMKGYQDNYAKFFDSYDVSQPNSLENSKKVLRELAHVSSSFHEFLRFVQYHTSAFSEPILALNDIGALNEFDFLTQVSAQDKGEAPLVAYQKIIRELINDLETPKPASDDILGPYLTPAAIVSTHILQNDSKSYIKRINDCLEDIGVPEKYRTPFVKPVMQLHYLGMRDLKKSVEQVFAMHFYPKIEAMLGKFPFDRNGSVTITVAELNEVLNPKEEFYSTINQVMSSCCTKKEGIWHLVDPKNMQLDERIFTSINSIQNIADLLWDKNGDPQPLHLNIKPVPFAQATNENSVMTLSYLVVGNSSIRNFNQTPTWQTINIDWWKDDTCTIGVELQNRGTGSKKQKYIQKVHAPWGFFELLREGQAETDNVWSWAIGNQEGEKYKVSLNFETNPQKLLQITN